MTRGDLHALPTYANWTCGRPIEEPDTAGLVGCVGCVGCGGITHYRDEAGMCPKCAAVRKPSADILPWMNRK